MRILGELAIAFFKIGLFTFGGGYAMLPLLQAEVAGKKKWVTDEDLMDYYSIGQCTPGIIAINVATFIGYRLAGKTGAVVATAAIVMPSLIIISLIAGIMQLYMHNEYLGHAFAGIRIGVAALILDTVISMWKKGVEGKIGMGIFAVAMVLLLWLNVSAVIIVLLAAAAGFLIKRRCSR